LAQKFRRISRVSINLRRQRHVRRLEFHHQLYNNVLGRDPTRAYVGWQVNFYNSLISGGQPATQARATLLQNFANSAEFIANTSINFDRVVLAFAGIDNTIPVSTTALPNLTLQQAGDLPLGTIAGALNDGVNGNGLKISSSTIKSRSLRCWRAR